MKFIIMFILIMLISSTTAFAAVSRSGGPTVITYTSGLTGSYTKAFWAVEETVSGCTLTGASCSGVNVLCMASNGKIRVVSYTPSAGGTLQTSVAVTLTGSGSCSLNNGQYAESSPGSLGSATALTGSVSLNLASTCKGPADRNCNGVITPTELNDAINNVYGDVSLFSLGTFTSSNIGSHITKYYGAA